MAFWSRKETTNEETSRQDTVSDVENEIAEQDLRYSYNNKGFTVHAPEGDQSFDWQQPSGLQQTLNWLLGRK